MKDDATIFAYLRRQSAPSGQHTIVAESLADEQKAARRRRNLSRFKTLSFIMIFISIFILGMWILSEWAINAASTVGDRHLVIGVIIAVLLKWGAYAAGQRKQAFKNIRASYRGQKGILRS